MERRKLISFENIILCLGIMLRVIAGALANPLINQHDVTYNMGHFDYATYFFMHGKMPDTNFYEFAQPPINAILQSLVMRLFSLFGNYNKNNYIILYGYTKILSTIWAIATLIIIYKILKILDIDKFVMRFVLTIMAIYPGLIVMTTQYSNDGISYMFFYLSLYRAIIWCKNKKLKDIVILAFSIGIGMLTKISVGLIAFIVGPMMLYVLIESIVKGVGASQDTVGASCASANGLAKIRPHDSNARDIMIQLIIFALIVFPIGLSYSIRNYVLFGQGFGEIFEIAKNTALDMKKYDYTIFDRFLSFPFDRLVTKRYGIYHDMTEYNIWVDLIKTATFDEFDYGRNVIYKFHIVLYVLNIIFYILSIIGFVKIIIDTIKKFWGSQKLAHTVGANYVSTDDSHRFISIKVLAVMLFILAICAYVSFNVKYQYSCNSNYRYIAYLTFAQGGCISYLFLH